MVVPSPLLVLAFCVACIFGQLFELAQAQNLIQAATDPAEVTALNTIFQKWGISANSNQWNISGEPCSGAAIDSTSFDDTNYNPFIKCDCSFNRNPTCHITQLKVYAQNVVGIIPKELWTLTFLFNLNLGQNYLTGNLSTSIDKLYRMQYLSFGINALSGTLPKELGNLTDLVSLSFSTNNFTGSLPSELGNLVKLEQLYFDSSGVSGAIPSSFANLKSLVTVWASDTELTARIPDFIGNWSKLTTLKLEGNSLEGPIPLAFSNLTSLTELRISDLSNGSSSLAFIRNMKSLSTLVLRNNNISDSIPSNIGEYLKLSQLDLSFNNIIGQIPNMLFNLSSLSFLFLGNNKLNGTVPAQKSGSLLNIDLSYNNLQGSFPSWVSEQNLQLNLVANNFTIESSKSSVLPSGLSCLQRGFPCNRGTARYSELAIKCGGPQITSSNGTVYERDNETLGPATYYVVDTDRWAVNNVGYFSGTNKAQYTSSSLSQFTNTLDSKLFQTARLSASSLRYYGLGLENGNYTVSLQFAEIAFVNSNTWQSLGRRIFDIYIQGNLVLKDFDIRKEAGGASFVAVLKEFNKVQVSENYLEIHLFWAGKGTCCVPAQGTYGPSISAISATPEFTPTVSNIPPSSNKNRTGLIVGVVVGVGVLSFLAVFVVFYIVRRRKPPTNDDEETCSSCEVLDVKSLKKKDVKSLQFDFGTIIIATNNFSESNKLGKGGFGAVYKGKLSNGQEIAVKRLSMNSRQGDLEFKNEVLLVAKLQHRNLIRLLGFCLEGNEKLLIYEFVPNISLDHFIYDPTKRAQLGWERRYQIIIGIARGILYLHEDSRLRIIHRDLKASNVLLDAEMNPKISDFGMAKLFVPDQIEGNTNRIVGTYGYMAPEYAMYGQFSVKSDVFSFGVLILEIVSGRKVTFLDNGENRDYLLSYAWKNWMEGTATNLIDPILGDSPITEIMKCIHTGLLCVQKHPVARPNMTSVVSMINCDSINLPVPTQPSYFTQSNVVLDTSLRQDIGSHVTKYELSITELYPR